MNLRQHGKCTTLTGNAASIARAALTQRSFSRFLPQSTPTEPKKKNANEATEPLNSEEAALEEAMNATWGEVFTSCCVHTPEEWGMIFIGVCLVAFFLYFFLFGLELLGNGAKVMTGCRAGELFGDDTNPVAGVMVGILATVLLQSSSTTTSIVVSLVGSDNAISVDQGIYMIMGANIGKYWAQEPVVV